MNVKMSRGLAAVSRTLPGPPIRRRSPSRKGMVVTAEHLASDVGAAILRQGGNAVDAAVAVGYALAVVYPEAGNLGGGGFMTIRLADGRSTFLDYREKAPLAASANMFLDAQGNVVPGLLVRLPGSLWAFPDRLRGWRRRG